MQKIAIISYFHYESSLCLAKSIAEQGVTVDYFAIVDMFHDKGTVPGIDYHKAPKHPGLIRLTSVNAPEICGYYEGLPVNLFLFRLVSFSRRLMLLNKIVFKIVLNKIKSAKYDAINIVGQWPWVEIIHNELKDENLTHTFHEVGSHFKGELSTPLMETVIRDKSKVILPSKSTLDRFRTLDRNCYCLSEYIPFGKFETLMLYRKPTELNIQFKNDSPIFLFYGFIKPYKGLDLLKRACEILNNRKVDFNLIVAGSGDDPTLPFYSTKKNCVVINRILYDNEMMYLNDISDVVLLPYKTASQSGIIPTSFIFGNPIIATKVGALVESIQDGKNGILVNAEDAVSFADAMQSLITDQNLMSLLKHGARQYGNGDEYDWHNIAKQTMSVLMNHKNTFSIMITSHNHLKFYLQSDMMMNRGYFKEPLKKKLLHLVAPDYIMEFLKAMRKVQYYSQCKRGGIVAYINKWRFFRLSRKLGFSIGYDVFDYGLVIPHYGTIVVGNTNRIGPYAVLHTSTCITDTGRKIGKALSLSTGAKITGGEMLGDHIVVAANSVVTKSFPEGNVLLVGMPAIKKTELSDWYSSLNEEMKRRVDAIECLKKRMEIE